MNVKHTVIIFLFILSCSISALSQTTPTPTPEVIEDDGGEIKIKSRLVVIPVSVLDAQGQPVLGLKTTDFRVLEENKAQEITDVSDAEKVPLEIAILFDVSASTDAMFQFQQETAAKFLQEAMRPEDRATIFTIGANPVIVQGRDTADKSAIAVKSIQPTKQFTAFYDTVSAAANHLRTSPPGRRKVIVVISDGEDTNSIRIARAIQDGYKTLGSKINTLDSKSLHQFTVKKRDEANISEQRRVLQTLQNADTVFYSINPAGSSYKLNKISVFGQSNLQKFADETGGTAYLPKFLPIDTKDTLQNSSNMKKNAEVLQQIFRQLTNELQAQYLVQYYSDADFPVNRYVKLDVGLQNPQSYRLRARQGYFVKE